MWYVYLIYVCAQNLISWKRLSLVSLKSWIVTDSIDIHNHFSSFLYSFHLYITFTYNFSSFHLCITFTYNFSSFFYSFHLCITFTKCLFILFQITLKQKRVRHKFSAGSLLEKLFAQTGNIFLIIFYVNRLYCVYVILLQALCYFYRPLLLDLWLTVRTGKVNSLDRPFTGQCLITVQTFLPLRSLVLVILQKKFPKMMKYPNNITEP